MICRHCQRTKVNRPRGLCWLCWHKPEVRKQYPSTSKCARRGVGNFSGPAPLPSVPTTVPAGPERVAVLAERAAAGESLWHPDDVREAYAPISDPVPVGMRRCPQCGKLFEPSEEEDYMHCTACLTLDRKKQQQTREARRAG